MESDFSRFSNLFNLHDVQITAELTPSEKKEQLTRQTNLAAHKVGNVVVECSYGTESLSTLLSEAVCG